MPSVAVNQVRVLTGTAAAMTESERVSRRALLAAAEGQPASVRDPLKTSLIIAVGADNAADSAYRHSTALT